MEEKELKRHSHLKKEIADLENRIIELGYGLKGIQYKDEIVKGSKQNNSIQEKIVELKDLLVLKRIEAIEEVIKIESYLDDIDDPIIRRIVRLKYIDCKEWDYIDIKLGYATDTARKIFYRYKNK